MNRLETLVEKKIREAIEEGEFDDLEGKGHPIDLREDPFEDPELRTVHRLLRNAGFAPAFIEERKAIDAEVGQALKLLQRGWELFGRVRGDNDAEWQRTKRDFIERINELNDRIRHYNLKAPSVAFHRVVVDAQKLIEQTQRASLNE